MVEIDEWKVISAVDEAIQAAVRLAYIDHAVRIAEKEGKVDDELKADLVKCRAEADARRTEVGRLIFGKAV